MRVLAVLLLAMALFAVLAASAQAKAVPMALSASATCVAKKVFVRLADGTIQQVTHATPGRPLKRVTRKTKNLYVVARMKAKWATVQRKPGQRLTLTAAGPAGEEWRWRFTIRSTRPLADPTNYIVCLRPKTRSGSFVRRMRAAPGDWAFTAEVTEGRLKGTRGELKLRS